MQQHQLHQKNLDKKMKNIIIETVTAIRYNDGTIPNNFVKYERVNQDTANTEDALTQTDDNFAKFKHLYHKKILIQKNDL